jgi:threonine/homoserine/homoserine lactone efflux protein
VVTGFLRGFALGFAIAAPVGPIGLLCIQRTLAAGRAAGLATGLGAAAADAVYGLLAAAGLGTLAAVLLDGARWIALAGGLLLLLLAWRTARTPPATRAAPPGGRALGAAFASTFALTLANPATILSFLAAFAALGLAGGGGLPLVAGVFAGSTAWWLILVGLVGGLRARVGATTLAWINRAAGLVLAGFGLTAVLAALRPG